MKVLRVVLSEDNIRNSVTLLSDLLEHNILVHFVLFIKGNMNCNFLLKKLTIWFSECQPCSEKQYFLSKCLQIQCM